MSNEDLRALAEKATPGEWYVSWGSTPTFGVRTKDETVVPSVRTIVKSMSTRADAAYIAAARPDRVIALLDENERLRDAARDVLRWWQATETPDWRERYTDALDSLRAALAG